jgi:hypothetical protein
MEEFGVPRVERSLFAKAAALAAASALSLSSAGITVELSLIEANDLDKLGHVHRAEAILRHEHKSIPLHLHDRSIDLALGATGAIAGDVLFAFISVGCVYEVARVADGYRWGSGAWD